MAEAELDTVRATTMEIPDVNQVADSVRHGTQGAAYGVSKDYGLGEFLSRPVLIHTETWAEGQPIENYGIYPLNLFLKHSSIKHKLNGFSRLRATVNLELVLNASPYQYGALFAAYKPCGGTGAAANHVMVAGGAAPFIPEVGSGMVGTTIPQAINQLSMLPHVVLAPADNSSGSLSCPFIWPNEWLDVTDLTDPGETTMFGALYLRSLGDLRTASASLGNPIDVAVFCWLTDVELMGPSQLSVNALSDTASNVAETAGALSAAPGIGPYARAAQVGASTVAAIARLFGWSHPVPATEVKPMIVDPTPSLACTSVSTHMDVLALDHQNGLSVGTGDLGYAAGDELDISTIVQRKGALMYDTWRGSDAAGTTLFKAAVTPTLYAQEIRAGPGSTSYAVVAFTPVAHIANLFRYWRGSLKFTVRFFPSKFHRGKFRVAYEPSGDLAPGASIDSSMVINKVVDIATSTSTELEIPFMAPTAWLENEDSTSNYGVNPSDLHWANDDSSIGYSAQHHNGTFVVQALNQLTGPDAIGDVPFVVYLSGGPDLEFAMPFTFAGGLYSENTPYSVNALEGSTGQLELGTSAALPAPQKNLVYMGEAVRSMRDVIKRSELYTRFHSANSVATTSSSMEMATVMPRLPVSPGFVYDDGPALVDTRVENRAGTADVRYNLSKYTFINWMARAFLGVRGGVMWRFVPVPHGSDHSIVGINVDRTHLDSVPVRSTVTYPVDDIVGTYASTASSSAPYLATSANSTYTPDVRKDNSDTGTSVSVFPALPTGSVHAPMYSRNKWYSWRPGFFGKTDDTPPHSDLASDGLYVRMRYTVPSRTTSSTTPAPCLDAYVCASDDFSYVFYCGPGLMFKSTHPRPKS